MKAEIKFLTYEEIVYVLSTTLCKQSHFDRSSAEAS